MTKRNDKAMKGIKQELYNECGYFCWLCGRKHDKSELTGHHRLPYRICKCTKKDNIYIACKHCHFDIINNIPYPSKEYEDTMEKMRTFRDEKR